MDDKPEHIVYIEASNWLRAANTIVWAVGATFIPISLACFAAAYKYQELKVPIAFGSILVWLLWIYMVKLYAYSGRAAREAVAYIEKECWRLEGATAFYSRQGSLYSRAWGSKYFIDGYTFIFIAAWLGFLLVPGSSAP